MIQAILEAMNDKCPNEDWSFEIQRQGNTVFVRFNGHGMDYNMSRNGRANLEGSFEASLSGALQASVSAFELPISVGVVVNQNMVDVQWHNMPPASVPFYSIGL